MVWKTKEQPFARLLTPLVMAGACGVAGCGGDSGSGDDDGTGGGRGGGANEPQKPDTGYGKGEAVPPARTCADFCSRFSDCITTLCSEDEQTPIYEELKGLLASSCSSSCTDSMISAGVTAATWQCYFQSSCREVFDYDECNMNAYYFCN